jgi:glycosyl transferase family 25
VIKIDNINKFPVSIFVVNLQNDIEKKDFMTTLCNKHQLKFEFIEAVDGRKLSHRDTLEVYNKEKSVADMGRELSKAELGCALSHKSIYKRILDRSLDQALILEDDIYFDESFLKVLAEKDKFPANWELILLGHHAEYSREIDTLPSLWYQKKLFDKYKLVRPSDNGYGTYGYLITLAGAKKLYNSLHVISKPIDHLTGNSKYINLYTVNPAPIRINDYLSSCFHSMQGRNDLQKRKSKAISSKPLSVTKRIAIFFRVYLFLISMRKKIIIRIKQCRLLRKY